MAEICSVCDKYYTGLPIDSNRKICVRCKISTTDNNVKDLLYVIQEIKNITENHENLLFDAKLYYIYNLAEKVLKRIGYVEFDQP